MERLPEPRTNWKLKEHLEVRHGELFVEDKEPDFLREKHRFLHLLKDWDHWHAGRI